VSNLNITFPVTGAVNGTSTVLGASVETEGRDDFTIGFRWDTAISAIAGVSDLDTGDELIAVGTSALFDMGYALDSATTSVGIRVACLDEGESTGSVGLYDDSGLVGEEIDIESTCFPQASGVGDAFLAFDQPSEWNGTEWVNTQEAGLVANLIFPDAAVRSVTAQLTDECTGSVGVSEFTSVEVASGYRFDPLALQAFYVSSTSRYEFPNPPSGPSVWDSDPPYGRFWDVDAGSVRLSLENRPPDSPPVLGEPNGFDTSATIPPNMDFWRFSLTGEYSAGTMTLDCIVSVAGATTVERLVPLTDERRARAIAAFYRPAAEASLTAARLYVGTWSSDMGLVYSGGYGISVPPADLGIESAETALRPRYRFDF
jgi:hypothetical protein